MHSAVTKRRDAGTYYTLDKERIDALLLTLPAKQGILLFLELKRNYNQNGATFGELVDALGSTVKTLENTLYKLLASGDLVKNDDRFFPNSGDNLPTVSPPFTPTLGENLGKTPPKYIVLDAPPEPLKEEKEKKEENKTIDPPTPQEKKREGKSEFDPANLELPNFLEPQVWRDWCEHRRDVKKTLTPTTAKQQLALLSKTPDEANAIITQSIERGWVGLFPLKENRARAGGSSRRGVKESTSSYEEDVSMEDLLSGPLDGNWGRDG